jgi:chromosome partitioning protein
VTTTTIANQKGGVGKTTSAINIAVLYGREGVRTLVVDTDPQCALTRQLGLGERSLGVNLVDVLAGRATAHDARSSPTSTASMSSPPHASSPGWK